MASTLGATLVFNIPVGLGIIKKEQQPDFVRGLLVGVIAIPFGSFFGGLSAGFPLALVAANIAPVAVISILLAVGLKFIPRQMTRGCLIFGYLVSAAGCVGLACAGFESITGVVLIPGMAPVEEGMATVAEIAIVLSGTFPVLAILMKVPEKAAVRTGAEAGAGLCEYQRHDLFPGEFRVPLCDDEGYEEAAALSSPLHGMVTASAVLGDHLALTASVAQEMILSLAGDE